MPINPRAGESKDEFISRCIATEIEAGKDESQAAAICYTKWEDRLAYNEPPVSVEFGKTKKVLFDEDFDEELVKKYKELGFKVYVKSKRKVKRKDKKTYNKLKSVGLTEDNLLFGDTHQLNKKYQFGAIYEGHNDPYLAMLMTIGKEGDPNAQVLKTKSIESMDEAIEFSKEVNNVELKFITVKTVFKYRVRDGVPQPKTKSREFCSTLMQTPNKEYTLDELQSLPTGHLRKMGLPADIFAYRGGFYRNPDTGEVTPFCRHEWVSEIKIIR